MLERRVGSDLIDRSKRPLELTPAGRMYFEGCRAFLETFSEMEDRVRATRNQVAGRVQLAAIYSVGLVEMEGYVNKFQMLYPKTEVHLDYLHPDEVYARVISGEADLGIVSFPRVGGEINGIPWREEEIVVAVNSSHRLANRQWIHWSDLNGEMLIGFTKELIIRKMIDRWLRSAGVTVEKLHKFDNIENIKRAVEIGAGVALLPAPTIRREVMAGTIRKLVLAEDKKFRPLGIIHRRNKSLSTVAGKLADLLMETADGLEPESALPLSDSTEQAGKSPVKERARV